MPKIPTNTRLHFISPDNVNNASLCILGNACQRHICFTTNELKECSGHGICYNMQHTAHTFGLPQNSITAAFKRDGPVYENWDKHMMAGCVCNMGWYGVTCNLQACPKGDDPRTTGQSNTAIRIVTSGTSGTQMQGYFTFHFVGFTAQLRANSLLDAGGSSSTFSNANCVAFITSLPNVQTATCVVSNAVSNNGGAQYDITLTGYPVRPLENTYYQHSGAPSVDLMGCSRDDITAGNSPTCSVTVQTAGTKEYAYCSNRGTCDFLAGKCRCHQYFYGTACGIQGALNNGVHDRTALALSATSSSYTSTLLAGHIKKDSASDFLFVKMSSAGNVRFKVDGQNLITAGGLAVSAGVTALDGGADWTRYNDNIDVVSLYSTHSDFTNDVLQLSASATASAESFNFLRYQAEGTDALVIKGNGEIVSSCTQDPTLVGEDGCIVTAGGIGLASALYTGGIIVSTDITDSDSKTTGSIVTPGGVGVALRAAMGSLEVQNAEQFDSVTTPAHIYSNNETHYVGSVVMVESSMAIGSSNFNLISCNINKAAIHPGDRVYTVSLSSGHSVSESAGVSVTQAGGLAGTLKTAVSGTITSFQIVAPEYTTYTISLSSGYAVSASAGVSITQNNGAGGLTGALKTALSGSITSIQIIAAYGLTWTTGQDIQIYEQVNDINTIDAILISSIVAVTWSSSADIAVNSNTVPAAKISIIAVSSPVNKFKVDGTGYVQVPSGVYLGGVRSGSLRGGLTIDAGGWTVAQSNLKVSGSVLLTSTSAQTWDHTGANSGAQSSGAAPLTFSTYNDEKIKIVGDSSGTLTIGNRDGGTNIYSGSLGLKSNTPIRFDGSTEDSNWLSIALAGDPAATHTITLPVIYTANVLSSASLSSSVLNSLGVLTGLTVTGTTVLSTSTAVALSSNTRASDFVGNLLQLDSAMSTASNAYNIILSRSNTAGSPATKFSVDGTGKMSAQGAGHAISSGGIELSAGTFTLTSNNAQAITHTGSSGSAGLTISSNVRVVFGGTSQMTLGSSSTIQTFKNDIPMFFEGENEDGHVLNLNVGNGPTGSSKTLTIPIDSTATVVTSASTQAVTIQSSHASGVQVESAMFVGDTIVHGSGTGASNFLTFEGVKFLDNAASLASTLVMSSHLTNNGGDILFTGASDQDITKSGGNSLLISSTHSGTVYTHIELWKFNDNTVDSTSAPSDLSVDGNTAAIEKFQCTSNHCFYKEAVYLWTLALSPSKSITESAGVVISQNTVTGVLTTALTGAGMTSIVLTVFTSSGVYADIVSNVDLVIGSFQLGHDFVASTTKTRLPRTYTLVIPATTITAAVGTTVIQGSHIGVLRIALTGANMASVVLACATTVTFNTAAITIGSVTVTPQSVSSALLTDKLIMEDVTILDGAMSGVTTVGMSSHFSNTGGDHLLTRSSNQLYTKSGGGDLILSGSAAVTIEGWEFTAGGVTDLASLDLTMDGTSAGLEQWQCKTKDCYYREGHIEYTITLSSAHSITASKGDAVTQGSGVNGVLLVALTGSGTSIVVLVPTGTIILTGTDLIVDSNTIAHGVISAATSNRYGDKYTFVVNSQTINQAKGVLVSQGVRHGVLKTGLSGAQTSIVIVAAAGLTFTTTDDLIVGSATIQASTISGITNNFGALDYIELELVRFMHGTIFNAGAITLMQDDLDIEGGNLLMTKSGNQLLTKSGSGNLMISGSAAVCAEDWCLTTAAAASASSHMTMDGLSSSAEKLKCTENVCEHKDGNSFIQVENVRIENGAMSTITTLELASHLTNTGGDTLLSKSGDQLITKSGGSRNLNINGGAAVCVEDYCTTAAAVASTSDLTLNGASVAMEQLKWIDGDCDNLAGNSYIGIEAVRMQDQTMSNIGNFGMSASLTSLGSLYTITLAPNTINEVAGVLVTQGSVKGVLKETVSGTTSSYVIIGIAGLTWATGTDIVVGSTTPTKTLYTFVLSTPHTFAQTSGVTVSQGTLSGTLHTPTNGFTPTTNIVVLANKGLSWSATAAMSIGSTTPGNVVYTIALSAGHAVSASAGVSVSQTGGLSGTLKASVSGTITTFQIIAAAGLTWSTTADITVASTAVPNAKINSATASNRFSSVTAHDMVSLVSPVQLSSASFKYTVSLDQGVSLSESAGVSITQGSLKGTLRLSLSGSVLFFEILAVPGLTWALGTDIVVGSTTVANARLEGIEVFGCLTNTGGDLLFTHSSNQGITKSGGGDLLINAPSDVKIEDWEFATAAVTDVGTKELSMDGASAGIEKLQCADKNCVYLNGGTSTTDFIEIEIVQFFNGAISGVTTVAMDNHLTNSGGRILLTKSANQQFTNSNDGILNIQNSVSNAAIEISNWRFIEDAVISPNSHISIDAASVRIENLKGIASNFFHQENANALGGTTAIELEAVSILNGAQSGKSLSLDPNTNHVGNCLGLSNTATQSGGSNTFVSITGTASEVALSVVRGDIEIGTQVKISETGITRMSTVMSSTNLADQNNGAVTMNTVAGKITVTGCTVAAGACSNELTLSNSKILSANSVVMITLAGYLGMSANTPGLAPLHGIPFLSTGTVASGSIKFQICNFAGSNRAVNGNIQLNFIVYSA